MAVLERIGAVSRKTGVGVETIRYYEKIGLIPSPIRGENGYRHYDERHIARLDFIKSCRQLGFSQDQIKSLLTLADNSRRSCANVKKIAETHLGDIQNRIAVLGEMEKILLDLIARCRGDNSPDCAIIERLSSRKSIREKWLPN